MSYEGYERVLCINGHLSHFGAYDSVNLKEWKCEHCSGSAAYFESVDQTNHCGVKTKLRVYKDREFKQCETCKHIEYTSKEQYYIPNNKISAFPTANVPYIKCVYEACDGSDKEFDTVEEAYAYVEKQY